MILGFTGGVKMDKKTGFAEEEIKKLDNCSLVGIKAYDSPEVLAEVGAEVKRGTLLGVADDVPVYSSVAGVFSGLLEIDGENFFVVMNEGQMGEELLYPPETRSVQELHHDDIVEIARNFGIIDSRSGKPLWKLLSQKEKFRRVVIDCTESDPLIAINYRLCKEKTKAIVGGAKVLVQATSALKCIFAAECSRDAVFDYLSDYAYDKKLFAMAPMEEKYPYSDRALMQGIYLKSLAIGETASDKNVLIVGVETALALYECMVTGMPQLDRYISFSGIDGKEGVNLCVPRGMTTHEIIKASGIDTEDCVIVKNSLLNGVLMGGVLSDSTHGFICVKPTETKRGICINCGACVSACPVRLYPFEALRGRNKTLNETCIACGCCEYICPSGIPLVSLIHGKKEDIKGSEAFVDSQLKGQAEESESQEAAALEITEPQLFDDEENTEDATEVTEEIQEAEATEEIKEPEQTEEIQISLIEDEEAEEIEEERE